MNNKIEIDWQYYITSGVFKKKGDPDPLPLFSDKSITDFYRLCKADPKIEATYKFIETFEKVSKLFSNNEGEARCWLLEKNSYFFNKCPLEVILESDSHSVLSFVNERLGTVATGEGV